MKPIKWIEILQVENFYVKDKETSLRDIQLSKKSIKENYETYINIIVETSEYIQVVDLGKSQAKIIIKKGDHIRT